MKNLFILILLLLSLSSYSQKVTQDENGNYIAVNNTTKSDTINTGKLYIDKKGKEYPVFKTARGKYYYPRISKSGNYYRAYLKIEAEEPEK